MKSLALLSILLLIFSIKATYSPAVALELGYLSGAAY
jgi:hypothetical protein